MNGLIGHNRQNSKIKVQVRLFNSLTRFAEGQDPRRDMELEAGTTVGELAARLGIPLGDVFLVLVNGRDITRGLVGHPVKAHHMLDDRDVVAFSGAVPYSYGYGAPVV